MGRLAVLPTVVIDASEVSTFIVQLVCSLLFVRVVLLFALLFSLFISTVKRIYPSRKT